MSQPGSITAIPQDVAIKLCAQIQHKYQGKWYTPAGMQCWGCTTFSKGDPDKMCINNQPDHRGCNLVNARYDLQLRRENKPPGKEY